MYSKRLKFFPYLDAFRFMTQLRMRHATCHGTLTGSFPYYRSHTILKLSATPVCGWTVGIQLLALIIVRVCIIEDGGIILPPNAITPLTIRHGVINMLRFVFVQFKIQKSVLNFVYGEDEDRRCFRTSEQTIIYYINFHTTSFENKEWYKLCSSYIVQVQEMFG